MVVDDPQGQGDQEEQVGYGEVHHEDLYLIEFLGRVQAGKDPQHIAVGNDPHHKDDAINNREESVSELRVHTRGIVCLHHYLGWKRQLVIGSCPCLEERTEFWLTKDQQALSDLISSKTPILHVLKSLKSMASSN